MNRLITLLFHDVYVHSPAESGFSGAGADRYKLDEKTFKAQLSAIAGVRADLPVLVTDTEWPANAAAPFAFSVDDGGLSYHSVLAPLLAEYGWRGHCMITTNQLGCAGFLRPHHIRELHAAGHLIGSHSVTHPPRFDTLDWPQLVAEWSRSKAVLEDIIGAAVTVGSVPGGYYARRVALAARTAGLEFLFSSEPKAQALDVDGCRVLGRFTLRRNSPPGLAGLLVGARQSARARQWLAWNGKKVLKRSLGSGYAQLSGQLSSRSPR
jgi:peptidoglycan/xylan/chitin deacetylase (PgdA/CDA1 family)